jgi:DNA-binding NarL/FixJ family response regulator
MGKRVLVADDHPLAREALRIAVRRCWPDVAIDEVGSVAQLDALLQGAAGYRLAVLDLMLPDAQGFSALLLIQKSAPNVPAVVISAREDVQTMATAHLLGASGFIPKSSGLAEISEALKRVMAGERVFPTRAHTGTASTTTDVSRRLASLSGAQLKVLIALADGRLNKQIAAEMQVTEATIKAHLTTIFRKLNVANRTQAVLLARPLLTSAEPVHGP